MKKYLTNFLIRLSIVAPLMYLLIIGYCQLVAVAVILFIWHSLLVFSILKCVRMVQLEAFMDGLLHGATSGYETKEGKMTFNDKNMKLTTKGIGEFIPSKSIRTLKTLFEYSDSVKLNKRRQKQQNR